MRNGGEFYLADALGSTLTLTDVTGAIATQYNYEPFGNTTSIGQATTNPFDFTGRESDGTGVNITARGTITPVPVNKPVLLAWTKLPGFRLR